ncbi:hypothetical protein BC941DRAFT_433547 [Chlamydoabsidia padenii]|nr:hypothetical protein BC941DRAFT_433547 [Chlamydoabsidia padenii]
MYEQQNEDIEQPASQEHYERLNTMVRKLQRKHKNALPNACCCCFDTRLGSRIACFIWAGLSLYFACLAFMNKSPFYSYFNQIPLLIFGVLNLFFSFVNMAGVFIITWKAAPVLLGRLSQVIWLFVVGILLDMFANYIVFLARPAEFRNWCIHLSQSNVQQAFNQGNQNTTVAIPFDQFDDYYNCNRLYQDEITWTLLCLVAMTLVYIHWAMVITSWERWYVIQPPRMAYHNDVKVDMPSPKLFPQPDVTMNQPDQEQPLPPPSTNINAPPYLPPSSPRPNANFPTSGQQQPIYNDNMNQMNPPGAGLFNPQYPSNYMPQELQENRMDLDPQYYQHPVDFDPRHQYQQQQDPYLSQQNNPYSMAHQSQAYHTTNGGPGEEGFYRY